ncbi:Radial spoke head protein 9 [Quaeritorhiza haematococci]|nr:Radial spoke head protein 9 [Quaeritorhiza haematococci]
MSFMSFDDLSYYSLAGFVLNQEERAALQTSLLLKRDEEKFSNIALWGKIFGIQKDYYIAQAWNDDSNDSFFERKYFYCVDLVTWLQLPAITPEELERIKKIHGRFYGEPAYEYGAQTAPPANPPAGAAPTDGQKTEDETPAEAQPAPPSPLNEEKRLAGVIATINSEVEIVPRGAYVKNQLGKLDVNSHFKGLSSSELQQLSSYMHFRKGYKVDVSVIEDRRGDFDPNTDIFEPISTDKPHGLWSLHVERGGSVVTIRNMNWPGYVFFHRPSTNKWGAVYYGTGQKNKYIGYTL